MLCYVIYLSWDFNPFSDFKGLPAQCDDILAREAMFTGNLIFAFQVLCHKFLELCQKFLELCRNFPETRFAKVPITIVPLFLKDSSKSFLFLFLVRYFYLALLVKCPEKSLVAKNNKIWLI